MTQMLDEPELVRNVAMIGALHSGKTAFCDCLWEMTHKDCVQKYYLYLHMQIVLTIDNDFAKNTFTLE